MEAAEMALESKISQPRDTPAEDVSAGVSEDVLSRESLLDLFDQDEELLAELATLFLADGQIILGGLEAAVAAGEAAKVEHAAHTMKGSVGNFGAKRAVEFARQLEQMGRSGNLTGAAGVLQKLVEELTRVNNALAVVARQPGS
jgi:protein-histidine pros-kinase